MKKASGLVWVFVLLFPIGFVYILLQLLPRSAPESFGGLSYASSHDNLELVLCERANDALVAVQ